MFSTSTVPDFTIIISPSLRLSPGFISNITLSLVCLNASPSILITKNTLFSIIFPPILLVGFLNIKYRWN